MTTRDDDDRGRRNAVAVTRRHLLGRDTVYRAASSTENLDRELRPRTRLRTTTEDDRRRPTTTDDGCGFR
jgi:hypothetical protein